MMSTFLTALLPLLGVTIGATLQYWFSRSTEATKQLQALRNQAYVDYLRAVAQSAHSTSPDDLTQARLLAAEAKARIVVYGAAAVVEALARFEETGARLKNSESFKSFLVLAKAMRGDSEGTELRAIELVLFGPRKEERQASARVLPPSAPSSVAIVPGPKDTLLPPEADGPSTHKDSRAQ
jgi:hypothetical protein